MSEKKKNSKNDKKSNLLTTKDNLKQKEFKSEIELFYEKESQRAENNSIKNRPIIVFSYSILTVFILMFSYIIFFMFFQSEQVIANPRNIRQDLFADKVERGDIITSDGVVLATSVTDENDITNRTYPYSNMFSHAVGYNVNGKAGLELEGNFYLLSSNINIFERITKTLKGKKNRGDRVITTLNFDVQEAAYNSLGGANGAAIAIEPDTGKIIAMVSKPDYDPNYIEDVWDYVNSDEGKESTNLLNRATQGLYPPGSTFKVVTALEFIKENQNYDSYSYECIGNTTFDNVNIKCNDNTYHGVENLEESLAYSCNLSFANIGMKLNLKSYRDTADNLLFNSDLPFEGEYNKSIFKIDENSHKYEIPQTAIGQGDTLITPLHNALIMCSIANGGVLMEPYIMDSVENDDGAIIKKFPSKSYGKLLENDESIVLTKYLKAVCDYGTASPYFYDAIYDVAGKTGTAEFNDEGGTHSWFVGFSDPDNPDLVVCVIVEESNIVGISASYVARQIFDSYKNK